MIYVMTLPGSNTLSQPDISSHNLLVDCHEPHAELLDLESGTVWQSHRAISGEAYDALPLPPHLVKIGIGSGVMDAHYFRRSPGAEADGPVAERNVEGHLFIHCANPPKGGPETPVGDDPRLLRVDKHHSLIFEAGAEVDVIRLPDGRDFVQVIAATPRGGGLLQPAAAPPSALEFSLPDGWALRSLKLTARTTIHLPHPTQAWFFKNGASFQGPVDV
jgi:hypothetical protein